MRERLLATALLFLFTSCSNKPKTDLERSVIRGDVSQITLNRYGAETKFGDIVKGKIQQHEIIVFNNAGNIASEDITYHYGAADSAQVSNFSFNYDYDQQGRNVKVVNAKDPKRYSEKKYSDDRLIELDDFDGGKLSGKVKYIYNNDVLAEVNNYDQAGKFTGKTKIKKDDQGFNTEIQEYKANGELESKYLITYDGQHNVVAEKRIIGGETFNISYKYSNIDNKGNWLTAIQYEDKKPSTYIERTIKYQ